MQILPPPGPQRTRQLVMLALLLVVGGYFAWRQYGPVPTATAPLASNPGTRATGPVTKVLPESVNLENLEPVPVPPEGTRNLFRFGTRPAPPPPPAPPPLPTPAPRPVGPPPVQGPPPIPFKALGRQVLPVPVGVTTDPVTGRTVQQVEHRTVVTLKHPTTGRVIEAVEGQIIDGQYKVLKIGLQSVEMSYLDGSGYVRIQIGGV